MLAYIAKKENESLSSFMQLHNSSVDRNSSRWTFMRQTLASDTRDQNTTRHISLLS